MDEIKLFTKLHKGDEKAREEIFKTHQAMVAKIAWGYSKKSSLSVEEMIAEGYVGLLQAINKFNLKKAKAGKVKFSSYAFWWIRRYIIRALVKKQSILSVPESVSELTHRYNHFAGILTQNFGREPTEMEVGKLLVLSEQQLASVNQRRALKEVSLDEHIFTDDESGTLADIIPAKNTENIEKNLEQGVLIEKYFSVLTPLEKAVLNLRFGLQKQPQLTYREIAENLQKRFKKSLSRQRVHQIFRAALKKIMVVRKKETSKIAQK
ncbi:MAG: sigma-70 family RNA polymerase sigma factor [Candidatus Ratteibacteria bacterium]|jgi:RNA polymerase primary sigma factor